ncbi:LysR family transcriptional regulator [Bosea sp. (in: a-proteobacteria)]|uniref:LysR family transcriptional regulator n=1 Tax=Bosea sp. (in: a-proteobacteria) TaxID=1871050 RepID=UPI002FC757F0
MRSMLTHDDLDLVLAIARTGRMKPAAEALQAHPATVYRRLEALEHRLGGKLFERVDGRQAPTGLAEEIIAEAEAIAERLDALNRAVAGRDARLSGPLTVTTTDTLQSRAMPVLAAFGRLHPRLELRLDISSAMADMRRNEADIAIRPTRSPPETLIGSKLGSFDYAVYTHEAGSRAASLAELIAAGGWIGLSGDIAQTPAARWLDENVPQAARLASVNLILGAALAARTGALALLPDYLGDDPLLGLRRVSPPVAELRSEIWLLTHPDLRYAAKVRAFMAFAGKALRQALRVA